MNRFNLLITSVFLLFTMGGTHSLAQSFTIQANGATDVCSPSCVQLDIVNPQPTYTYEWYFTSYSCYNQSTLNFSSNTSITACNNGKYFCVSTNPNGVTATSNAISIRVLPGGNGLPLPYSQATVNCEESITMCIPAVLTDTFSTSITWYKDNVVIPGANSASLQSTGPGVYKYELGNGCGSATSPEVTLNQVPAKPGFTQSPPGKICSNSDVTFNVNNPSPLGIYSWEIDNGGGYGNVAFGNSYTHTVGPIGDLKIRVTELVNGCFVSSDPDTVEIELNIPQVASGGVSSFCGGESVLLTVNAGLPSSNFAYQWYRNGSPIAGATGNSHLTKKGGSYYAEATAQCGTRQSMVLPITKYPAPVVSVTANGSTEICKTDSVQLLGAVSGNGPFNLQWKKYGNDVIGATNQGLYVKTRGKYKLLVTDVNGCARASNTVVVTINPLPLASITANGPVSFCDGGSVLLTANSGQGYTYQWKNYNTLLPGQTNQSYTATFSGKFKCLVSDSIGCVRASNAIFTFSFPCPSREGGLSQGVEDSETFSVNVFPNPSSDGNFNLTLDGHNGEEFQVLITDVAGRVIDSEIGYDSMNTLSISGLDKGVYFVTVNMNGIRKTKRIVSTNQ